VDTVLAKLYAQTGNKVALHTLLQEKHEIVLSEVESTLRDTGNISALCILYKERKLHVQLLDTWSKCVWINLPCSITETFLRLIDGEWTDEEIQDPTSLLIALLAEKKDRALSRKWGVWLTKRDPDRGLKVRCLWLLQPGFSSYLYHTSYSRRQSAGTSRKKMKRSCLRYKSPMQQPVLNIWST